MIALLAALVGLVHVPRWGEWDGPMVVCPSQDVAGPEFGEAVQWWRDMGWNVAVGCGRDARVRVSYDPDQFERGLALRRGRKPIASCSIVVSDRSAVVVAHEIGHCLGFEHSLHPGHLMHRRRVGWDGRGLHAPGGGS